ncbi:MAG: hypothetical protein ACLVC5_09370 [Clostridia bacterium]
MLPAPPACFIVRELPAQRKDKVLLVKRPASPSPSKREYCDFGLVDHLQHIKCIADMGHIDTGYMIFPPAPSGSRPGTKLLHNTPQMSVFIDYQQGVDVMVPHALDAPVQVALQVTGFDHEVLDLDKFGESQIRLT